MSIGSSVHDKKFMMLALEEAAKALKTGEVPIGAIAVMNDGVIGTAHNMREATKNPLGHAEILLMEQIIKKDALPSWRFDDVTIYITCEPCIMCMAAMREARVKEIFYGCKNPSLSPGTHTFLEKYMSPKIEGGIMADECGKLLSSFFKNLRQ